MNEINNRISRFKDASLALANTAIRLGPDALVLIGGNSENCNIRQKEIFYVVNTLHNRGQLSYWYKSANNANLDIPDQVVPGQSYVVVNFDLMSISNVVIQ